MRDIDRRTALGYSAMALSVVAGSTAFAAPQSQSMAPPEPSVTNPLAARTCIYTIVTADMAASTRFYCNLLNYETAGHGKLGGKLPTVAGVGEAGRRYALLRPQKIANPERGMVRLLEAPAGAQANRPRPQSSITEPGMAVVEIMTADIARSYAEMTKAGIKTVSEPLYYFRPARKPLPGSNDPYAQKFEILTYSLFGPAGEQLFISQGLKRDDKPFPPWSEPALHGPLGSAVLITRDRWPTWHFYKNAFGLLPTKDQFSMFSNNNDPNNINTLIGAPLDSYYRFGGLGDGMGLEWWEFREWETPPQPLYPTQLDRTGLAMATFIVDDLAHIRANLQSAQIGPIGEGGLPSWSGAARDGLYLRGPNGELIEVIGRG